MIKKICPYVQNQHIQVQKNIPNEKNPDIIEKYVTTNIWGNAECIGERCGAYFDGKCHYNG